MIRFLVSQFLINLHRYYKLISHSPGDPPQYFRNQFSKFNSLDNQLLWKTIYFIELFYVEMYIMSFGSRSTSGASQLGDISRCPGEPSSYFDKRFSKLNSLDNNLLWKTIYFVD